MEGWHGTGKVHTPASKTGKGSVQRTLRRDRHGRGEGVEIGKGVWSEDSAVEYLDALSKARGRRTRGVMN